MATGFSLSNADLQSTIVPVNPAVLGSFAFPGRVDRAATSRRQPVPGDARHLGRRSADLAQHMQLRKLEDELSRVRSALVCSLVTLVDLKDLETGLHSTRLATWAVRVGKRLGLVEEDVRDVEVAALLHDVGKLGIPDSILLKKTALTDEDFRQVRLHPEFGWGALRVIPGFERVALYVLYHHERIDGEGYPAGLSGDEIPRGARIVAVVDAFDAMTSCRVYRESATAAEALPRLEADSGTQFDDHIVGLFVEMVRRDLGSSLDSAELESSEGSRSRAASGHQPISRFPRCRP